jgi:prenyltransferase beta subunit
VFSFFFLTMLNPALVAGLETREQLVIDFSTSCIDDSGGAALHPSATNIAISTTYATAGILELLHAWTAANDTLEDQDITSNMTAWIQALQNTTTPTNNTNYGGFVQDPDTENATITDTYYAIQTLYWLNQSTCTNCTLAANFTINLQRLNATEYPDTIGGFADSNQSNATIAATYFALVTLSILNQLEKANHSLAIAWLNSCQILSPTNSKYYGSFTNGRNSTIGNLMSTYMAIRGLELLDSLSSMNQSAAIEFILSCYHSDSNYPQYFGGFGQTPDEIASTHLATYYAVAALVILDAIDQVSGDDVTTWIIDKQVDNGGFSDSSTGIGLSTQTYLAVATLSLLGQMDALDELVGFELFIFPWFIAGFAVIIILFVVCVILAKRAEWF